MTLPHTYTRENLTDLLTMYTGALGRAPRTTDIRSPYLNTVFLRWAYKMGLTDPRQFGGPSRNVICNVFGVGTWAKVLAAAGLTEMVVEGKKPYGADEHEPWSAEDVVAAYREIIRTEGVLPGQDENKNLYRLRTKFFESEKAVVEAAGYNYDFLRKLTDRVRLMRREGIKSAGYYDAMVAMYPNLAKYGREYVENYMGEHPARGQIYDRMGEPVPTKISPAEHWKLWQKHYKDKLYHTPAEDEPHEMAFAQAIMMSGSPAEAFSMITRLSKKYPSSVGADMADEFKRLWVRTRVDVLHPERRLKHPGYIQFIRPRKAG